MNIVLLASDRSPDAALNKMCSYKFADIFNLKMSVGTWSSVTLAYVQDAAVGKSVQ